MVSLVQPEQVDTLEDFGVICRSSFFYKVKEREKLWLQLPF